MIKLLTDSQERRAYILNKEQELKTPAEKKNELEEYASFTLDQGWMLINRDGVPIKLCDGDELVIVTLEESFDEKGSYKSPVGVTVVDASTPSMVYVRLPSGKLHFLGKGDKILYHLPKNK